VKFGGLFETAFGLPLGEIVEEIAGGTASRAAGQGGAGGRPAWRLFPGAEFDTPFGYEEFDGPAG
jgi:formate dehydrogenase iron-sulfur subunit